MAALPVLHLSASNSSKSGFRFVCGQVGDQGLQASPTELVTTGGRVNLRHLREDVAYLAWRLRQHTASVFLPPELQDLRPQVSPRGDMAGEQA